MHSFLGHKHLMPNKAIPYASPVFAGQANANGTTSYRVYIQYPTGIESGDLLIIFVTSSLGSAIVSEISGFTLLSWAGTSSGISTGVFYKIATGSESGGLYVYYDDDTGEAKLARMVRVTGANKSNPFIVTPQIYPTYTADTVHDALGHLPTEDYTLSLMFYALQDDQIGSFNSTYWQKVSAFQTSYGDDASAIIASFSAGEAYNSGTQIYTVASAIKSYMTRIVIGS